MSPRCRRDKRKPLRPMAQMRRESKGSRRIQDKYSGDASYFQTQRPVEALKRESEEGPTMAARRWRSGRAMTQQRSWMPCLESVSNQRIADLRRKSRRAMRPWRSPAARRR